MEKNRGILTENIKEKALQFLKREISQKELRLYPYIDHAIKNGCVDWSFYSRMDLEELNILSRLEDEGHLIYSSEKIIVSKAFYDFMQEMLALGYVEEFLDC